MLPRQLHALRRNVRTWPTPLKSFILVRWHVRVALHLPHQTAISHHENVHIFRLLQSIAPRPDPRLVE